MFGWKGALTAQQLPQIPAARHVIYERFQEAIAKGMRRAPALCNLGIAIVILIGAATPLMSRP
jgi:hypothetical protein